MAKDFLADNEMVRGWHDVVVRFGKNTLPACCGIQRHDGGNRLQAVRAAMDTGDSYPPSEGGVRWTRRR